MSASRDLTRWNRAGLTRFRYVDGNAVEYLEILRQELVEQFKDPRTGQCQWLAPAEKVPANEKVTAEQTLLERQERLGQRRERMLETYYQDRRDITWEISRTFARACHILTEHTNAYANEGYLGTATQWEHVRRLVEMLDYHPAPPASASTKLVLQAKPSRSGLVKKGWQVKYKPPAGGDKVVFETLDDVKVHAQLNGLRVAGYDKSTDPLGFFDKDKKAQWPWLTEDKGDIGELELSAGSVAILVNTPTGDPEQAMAVTIEQVDNDKNLITLSGVLGEAKAWTKGETRLLVSPKDIATPRLNGDDVIRFAQPHGLSAGDVIAWRSTNWHFDKVFASDDLSVKLYKADPMPAAKADIFKGLLISRPVEEKDAFKFPYDFKVVAAYVDGGFVVLHDTNGDYIKIKVENEEKIKVPSHSEILKTKILEIFLIPTTLTPLGTVSSAVPSEYIFNGGPGDLASGQWVVVEYDGKGKTNHHLAMKIRAITEYEDHFAISFDAPHPYTPQTAKRLAEDLQKKIRKLQPLMNEKAMRHITLGQFQQDEVAKLEASCIQGVGEHYYDKLKGSNGTFTIEQLAKIEPASMDIGISQGRLNEFKTNAERVLGFKFDEKASGKLSARSLSKILATSVSDWAKQITAAAGTTAKQRVGGLKRLYGPFEHALYPKDHDRNDDSIMAGDGGIKLTGDISDEALALLKLGRRLVLEREDGSGTPASLDVQKVVSDKSGKKWLYLSRNLTEKEVFSKGSLIIRGNVVLAGHGERKPEKILGSGNAMLSNQSFTLAVKGVAFTADATKSSGVAAALDVSVGGQIWTQVSTLKDSAPGDHHYAIRMTEGGLVKIMFGDGEYGRRLPTGANNVRVRYRVGSGLSGNVPAGGLEKPVNPHPLIDTVRQPLQAAGGGDMEEVTSLRENAPPTLLALERAVSLSDFTHLAAAQSSVWQAKTYRQVLHGGKVETVEVVIVPAGGVQSDETEGAIKRYLQRHAPPGIQVRVHDCKRVYFSLSITVWSDPDAFIADDVKKDVTAAITDHFKLKNRKLGEHLYLSEVYKVVEGIQGVENSICVLNGDEAEQVMEAEDDSTVIFLDITKESKLEVDVKEYEP